MAGGVKVKISEEGAKALEQKIARIDRQLEKLGKEAKKTGDKLEKGIKKFDGALKGAQTALAGLAIGKAVKDVMAFDDVMARLQDDLQLSNKDALKMRDRVLDLASSFGVAKEEVAATYQLFQDQGGKVKEGDAAMKDLIKMHKVTGASMEDLARVHIATMDKFKVGPDEAVTAMMRLHKYSLVGSMGFREMSKAIGEVAGQMGGMYGFRGARGVEEMGTALQLAGSVLDANADKSKTAVLALMSNLNQYSKELKRAGVAVYEGKGKDKRMRRLSDVMKDIHAKTGGDPEKLKKVFGESARPLVAAYMDSIRGGKEGLGAKVMAAGKGGGERAAFEAAFKRHMTGIAAESEKAKQAMNKFDQAVQDATKSMVSFAAANPAIAVTAALVGKGIMSYLGSAGLKGIVGEAGAKSIASKAGAMKGLLMKAGGVALAGAAGYAAGTWIDSKLGISDKIGGLGASRGRKLEQRQRLYSGDAAIAASNAREKMAQFIAMRRRGVTAVGGMELNARNAALLAAREQGAGSSAGLVRELEALFREKFVIEIKTSGVEKITAKGKRQRQ